VTKSLRFSVFSLTLGMLLALSSMAHAQATRTWVSGVGDDANPCSRTAPCKTFAGAISKTAPGGEIDVLDPGGFGALTITKAISIEADGLIGGVLVSGTNAFVVAAGVNDNVVIRGITFEGLGTGLNGVDILSAASVLIDNCYFNGFVDNAIAVEPGSPATNLSVTVQDTSIRDTTGTSPNGFGVYVKAGSVPTAVTLNRVLISDSDGGVRVDQGRVTIRDSTISNNTTGNGIVAAASPGPSIINVENTMVSYNTNGIFSSGAASVIRISNTSVLDNSSNGLLLSGGGVINTWGNNKVAGNPTTAPTASLTAVAQQ
jgi:hypothetical protein